MTEGTTEAKTSHISEKCVVQVELKLKMAFWHGAGDQPLEIKYLLPTLTYCGKNGVR